MSRPEQLREADYLRHIEHLAREIVNAAHGEGWVTYGDDPEDVTPLQRSVNEMARQIRHYHFDSDGCLDPELPIMKLAGVVVLQPQAVPLGIDETYDGICARLGSRPGRRGGRSGTRGPKTATASQSSWSTPKPPKASS